MVYNKYLSYSYWRYRSYRYKILFQDELKLSTNDIYTIIGIYHQSWYSQYQDNHYYDVNDRNILILFQNCTYFELQKNGMLETVREGVYNIIARQKKKGKTKVDMEHYNEYLEYQNKNDNAFRYTLKNDRRIKKHSAKYYRERSLNQMYIVMISIIMHMI